ncbi:MAG: hypothetical protein ACD_81C00100G0005 [uncultured bacterium]|uniref:Uncharacterized protein n=1 Tax=Candidatus Wolfebacteria bacterium GW2011_GWE2_44_13 TaxID=1619017 RepID=A0A0G1H904_9BACT|nr:MAG: hypothetical protein ACD_81C00100G0005 [uncultured bacterium]KKT42983.1 MAG: hypothetical protein UW32_C0003G0086 [Candidatus Wolfebacteria bacterium GW2011_GWE2_44_13]
MLIIRIVIAIFLGWAAARLIMQSWLSFVAAVVALIGVIRRKQIAVNLGGFALHMATLIVVSVLLWGIDYVSVEWFKLGYATIEIVAFWGILGITVVSNIPNFILHAREGWKMAMDSEYLEKKTRETRRK